MKKIENYSGFLTCLMALLLGALVAGCNGGGQDPILGVGGVAVLAPTVIAVTPANNATGVLVSSKVTATFSKDMAPATISTSTFKLACPVGTSISGTVAYDAVSRVATFSPSSNLPAGTLCTATITTGARDTAGIALASAFVWKFTTTATADTTRPTVTLTVPAAGATGVATNTKITATFSEDMNPATINGTSFTLTGPGSTVVAGSVTYAIDARTATFTPTTPATLPASTSFTATITTGARDLAGNALAGNQAPPPAASNFVWTFTTGAAADTTPPTVTLVNPPDLATGVCLQKSVSATFSEVMDPATITTATFILQLTGPPLGPVLVGSVSYDVPSKVATFTPTNDLLATTSYTATITTGVKDLAGNALASNKVWTFTTAAAGGNCLAPVALGSASSYGTFGGSAGMTNSGLLTVINGDIGTTAVSTAVTGFHDAGPGCIYTETPLNIGTVNGTINTAAPPPTVACPTEGTAATFAIATQARADALTTYNALVAEPAGSDPGAGSLANLVLTPGVYTAAAGSFLIQGGDLTLDAQGDANAVWVFQMATTLTVGGPGAASPQSVILINGAQARNVYWQVGTAATINAAGGGTMVGTIIAQAGLAFSTAGNTTIATLDGRALSLGASVTLVDTHINVPAP